MRTFIVSVVFLFLATNIVQGQVKFFRVKNLNADSLVVLIMQKEGTDKIDLLNLLSNVISRKDIDSSINLAVRAIDLSEKLEYQKGLADGYFNVGNGYFLLDSLQPTIINYLKAQRIYEDLEPSEEYANLLMQLGTVNYFTGRIEVSRPYNRQANRIYESLGDKEGLFIASFGMGIYYHVHRPLYLDSVIYYCLNAKSFFDTLTNQDKLAYLYAEIGEACQAKFRETLDTSYLYDALSWNYKGQALPNINEDSKSHLYAVALNIYDAFNTAQGLDSCKAILERVRDLCDTCKYLSDNKTNVSMWLGWISYREGDYDNAIKFFKQCIAFADAKLSDFSVNDFNEPINGYNSKFHLKSHKRFIYSYLYKIYNELGHFEQALENYILWRQMAEEIYMDGNQNLIAWMGSVSENEKTEKQIALLARDNELHKTKVAQSRTYMIAMGGFVIILILLTVLFIRQRKTQLILREQKLLYDLELKEIESKKLKELDQLKSRFFANISHEFRTPLTLILSPAEKLLSKVKDENIKNDLQIIHRYARRLRRLINQLLNLAKLEAGELKLNTKKENIIKLVKSFTQSFESLAIQRQITLFFSAEREEEIASVDRNKLEIIINNLLSNAFKFTPEKGKIEVVMKDLTDIENNLRQVQILVSDSGIGIPQENLDKIFERFYMVDDTNSRQHEGTGIGLALAKELVELHQGEIHVESQIDKGTTFRIILPLDAPDQLMEQNNESDQADRFDTLDEFIVEPVDTVDHNQKLEKMLEIKGSEDKLSKPVLLIVDDNPDLRAHIRFYLSDDYQILEARDGEEGLAVAVEYIPDLIISDVMMPKMDGNIFCEKIKADERTSHIPVILLTARASKESKIEGLETGADDFITKPFDMDELLVRIKNIIGQRKRLSLVLEKKIQKSHNTLIIDFEDSGITSMDEEFLQKVIKILKEQYANPEFGSKQFSQHIGVSVAQLNRKIKALTGQTTGESILTFRLNRAAELIKNKSANIAEIAYDVGFNSPSYFTECFKNHFGELPSEYNGITHT